MLSSVLTSIRAADLRGTGPAGGDARAAGEDDGQAGAVARLQREQEVVRPGGFEPTTYSSGGCRSIHLSYGRLIGGAAPRLCGIRF